MITFLKAEEQHQHKNGGGWVANTATVDTSVYIGADAQVSGDARVPHATCYAALWHSKKVSGGQMAMLKRLFPHKNFDFNLMNSGQASRLISERLTRRAK